MQPELSDTQLSPGVVCIDGITDDKNEVEIRSDPQARRLSI